MNVSDDFRAPPDNIVEFNKLKKDGRPGVNQPLPSPDPQINAHHIISLVTLPAKVKEGFDYEAVLLPALSIFLELDPYYWQVVSANNKLYGETISSNVSKWIEKEQPQVYILDISDRDFEIVQMLGYLRRVKEEYPILIILLEQEGGNEELNLSEEIIRIVYSPVKGEHAIRDISGKIDKELRKRESIQQLINSKNLHFLSPLHAEDKGLKREVAQVLSASYKTMEAFANADMKHIRMSLRSNNLEGVEGSLITAYQRLIIKFLKTL